MGFLINQRQNIVNDFFDVSAVIAAINGHLNSFAHFCTGHEFHGFGDFARVFDGF
jgi:hypothetical protein